MSESSPEHGNIILNSTPSHPIEIPISRQENSSSLARHYEEHKHSKSGHSIHHHNKPVGDKHLLNEEDHHLPDGSPSFTMIMSELGSSLSKTTIRPEIEFPVSPLAHSQEDLPEVFSSDEAASPETKSPPLKESPQTIRKRLQLGQGEHRNRAQSWNYRNKMPTERRKQLNLTVPHPLETNSAHSSPMNVRKKKVKSQPGTPQLLHVHPKFKILTQNLSVSHEDLVKGQEQKHHLAEGFSEVKSIFDAPNFDRSGATPELE